MFKIGDGLGLELYVWLLLGSLYQYGGCVGVWGGRQVDRISICIYLFTIFSFYASSI